MANRVTVNSTAVVKGDIFHRTLVIGGSDASKLKGTNVIWAAGRLLRELAAEGKA